MTGDQLRKKREQMGLSQRNLAAILEIPQPRISEMERGKIKITKIFQLALRTVERENIRAGNGSAETVHQILSENLRAS